MGTEIGTCGTCQTNDVPLSTLIVDTDLSIQPRNKSTPKHDIIADEGKKLQTTISHHSQSNTPTSDWVQQVLSQIEYSDDEFDDNLKPNPCAPNTTTQSNCAINYVTDLEKDMNQESPNEKNPIFIITKPETEGEGNLDSLPMTLNFQIASSSNLIHTYSHASSAHETYKSPSSLSCNICAWCICCTSSNQ